MKMKERTTAKTTVSIMQGAQVPCIWIEEIAMAKMKEYIKGCSDEIGWLCSVEKHSETNYRITDSFLFKQEVHSTTTEITPEGLNDFAMELLARPDGMDIWNNIKCWGHSHVNMGVTPSGQDDNQMNVFKGIGHEYFIRVIGNKKGEMEFTLYDYKNGIIYKDVPWVILRNEENAEQIKMIKDTIAELQKRLEALEDFSYPDLEATIKAEIAEKVKKKSYGTVYSNTWGSSVIKSYGGYQGNYIDDMLDDYYDKQWQGEVQTLKKNETKKEKKVISINDRYNYPISECLHYEDLLDWFLEDDLIVMIDYLTSGQDDLVEMTLNTVGNTELSKADHNYLKRMMLDYGKAYGIISFEVASEHKKRLLDDGLKV